jgi:hypothetical protein
MVLTMERKDNRSETNSANFNLENAIKSIEIQKKAVVHSSNSSVTMKNTQQNK